MTAQNPKTLVIFFSLSGNCRYIAETIAKAIGADTLELRPKYRLNPRSFMRFVLGGAQVFLKIKPRLEPLDRNPADYDLLILGTPVWASSFAPAFRTMVSKVKLTGKRIALYCCYIAEKGQSMQQLTALLKGNEIVGTCDFLSPQNTDFRAVNTDKAAEWAREIAGKMRP